jgi:short-subunit dehydrogenase
MTRTALITGASSGIGYELTKLFAADGYDVVLVARREQRLQELATEIEQQYGVTATVIPVDLAEPGGPQRLFDEVTDHGIEVHTLVNNAGFGNQGRFDQTEIEVEASMIDLNVTAVTRLTKLFVRPMVDRGEGAVLNTASMAGMAPTPTQAVYSSTKAYILSFSEAIAAELADEGVTVTALCPGPVDTEFFEANDMADSGLTEGRINDPASVALEGYEGLKRGETVVVPSRRMKLLSQAKRLLPRQRVVGLAERTVTE